MGRGCQWRFRSCTGRVRLQRTLLECVGTAVCASWSYTRVIRTAATDETIKSVLFWDVNNGVARRLVSTSKDQMRKRMKILERQITSEHLLSLQCLHKI